MIYQCNFINETHVHKVNHTKIALANNLHLFVDYSEFIEHEKRKHIGIIKKSLLEEHESLLLGLLKNFFDSRFPKMHEETSQVL